MFTLNGKKGPLSPGQYTLREIAYACNRHLSETLDYELNKKRPSIKRIREIRKEQHQLWNLTGSRHR